MRWLASVAMVGRMQDRWGHQRVAGVNRYRTCKERFQALAKISHSRNVEIVLVDLLALHSSMVLLTGLRIPLLICFRVD